MSTTVAAALAFVLGAVVGSFLNVVAHRLPRGESLARPGSRCPVCGTPIRPWDNVPVLSWLALRGRCRACRARISPRYPVVEALTGAGWALVVVVHGAGADALLGLALVSVLVPITLVDLDVRLIPNALTLAGALLALGILALVRPQDLLGHLAAAGGAGGFLLLAVLAYPGGMGLGDVKLVAMLGLFLGSAVVPALFVAFVTGTLVGVAIMGRVGVAAGRKVKIPFGPYLAFGGLVGLLVGDALVDWYLRTIL